MKYRFLAINATLALFTCSVQADQLEEILKKLDNPNFAERTKARTLLSDFARKGDRASIEKMLRAYGTTKSPEARISLKHVAMLHLYGKGFLGVQHRGLFFSLEGKDKIGIFLDAVTPDSPAAKAGLRNGDVIYEIGGKAIKAPPNNMPQHSQILVIQEEFSKAIKSYKQGETVEISYARDGNPLKTKATLASYNKYLATIEGGIIVDAYGFTTENYRDFESLSKEMLVKPRN